MIYQTTNIFIKGCISDIDKVHMTTDYWTFPTMNAQLMTKDGQGYILTPMKGNTQYATPGGVPIHNVGEEFALTLGFVPLGACEFNGILYIASYNQSTGEGEVGCFPSPDFAAGITTFTRTYRALYNYDTGGGRGNLTTALFAFDITHQIDMFARKDYDDSVNIYMCDYKNRNRVINSGFKQTGELTPRIYTPECFDTFINLYPTTQHNKILTSNLDWIKAPGQLLYGNYFVYIRYLTHDYNPTDIVGEFGPYQVYRGTSYGYGDEATVELCNVDGGWHDDDSGKHIRIRLNNLDQTYKYVKVYYSRYFADASGVIQHENKEIIAKYEIQGTSMLLFIDGYETSLAISDGTLLRRYPDDIISKNITQSGNTYWGSNWKNKIRNHNGLVEFAQRTFINVVEDNKFTPPLNEKVFGGTQRYFNRHPNHSTYKNYYHYMLHYFLRQQDMLMVSS